MNLKFTAALLALVVLSPLIGAADPSSKAAAVLATEKSWNRALATRDVRTLQQLLAQNYAHVDSTGTLYDRQTELAGIKTMQPFHETWSGQGVTFAGDVAVVRGISTQVQNGKTVRQRYTDVYQWQNNRWKAISAQETFIK